MMAEAGMMKDLARSLKTRLSRRGTLLALPAVVGLLPMPAGALFSAPLVDDADDAGNLDAERKACVNYWCRHIWEFWWPLYPGVLLAVDMSGLSVWMFSLLLFPLFLAAVAGAWWFILRDVPQGPPVSRGPADKAFLPLIFPIIAVIAVYLILLAAVPAMGRFNKYLPMVVGVIAGLFVLQIQRPASLAAWGRAIFSKRVGGLVLIVILARIYGAFIEARLPGGGLLMERIRAELDVFGIPAVLLVVVIPFVSGLTTGITVGYIGASFPVALSLALPENFYSTIILGYASGYIGMMLSPIHVCLIVTNEYFKTGLLDSLRRVLKPAGLVFAAAIGYYFLALRFPPPS
jgi:integral membrane protein (TIGR00529 family)